MSWMGASRWNTAVWSTSETCQWVASTLATVARLALNPTNSIWSWPWTNPPRVVSLAVVALRTKVSAPPRPTR